MSDTDLENKKKEAEARKAEAEARAAEAAREKAELDAEEYKSDLARAARQAALRKEIADAQPAPPPAPPTRAEELATLQKQAEAEKAIQAAEVARVESFIPDFSKIDMGSTTVSGKQAVQGSGLAHAALRQAAASVVGKLALDKNDTVLITGDADLVSSDAVYLEVTTACEQLTAAAGKLLADITEAEKKTGVKVEAFIAAVPAVVSAVASALPGFMSLFSTKSTLTTHEVSIDSEAAIAAVAGALLAADQNKRASVFIDDFRLVPDGQVAGLETKLRGKRSELAAQKLELEHEKSEASRVQAALDLELAPLRLQLAALPENDPQRQKLQQSIDSKAAASEHQAEIVAEKSVSSGAIDSLSTAIDAFLGALHKVPTGGNRSPFALAALREQLHPSANTGKGGSSRFTKVLFVRATSAGVDQLVEDIKLKKDRIHSIGSATVAYWLLDPTNSKITASGIATGTAEMTGTIGGELTFS